jgi:hypothetical protein
MNDEELAKERDYRYQERLGILCGADKPTPEQEQLAAKEADETVLQLMLEAGE